ncbi:MAG: hypothetical protein A3F82_08540 [Deltaproteobacteria bacterium RIFCSPLOWO2_12_FULL_44_12]|nr:MAG: hypothetical protein A2712_00385 [Deltaproteobacteria bacterium RIFCSPHIGHO2_01_FULL_43_49]OGQ15874.1 MAG: hypothetical protein A3D22_03035 [Deltaproteobacteria bacterium RIFCSPHIGHO2_02_FULL_44_53]OGQ28828.1 MAG: hypothetical protein A3D98_01365 [Deltaproteobacteria bacterium RIFCSPHIGHO2_12_FULL_44_21]OGQ32148.1 MAG: hypothetical protein A2979_03490 [Deltaproteobacteria bacterium RIFCSPLOWO2_01_FULL_45_74]OGQ43709.1 MAG: hypothetical protein A3I70_05500 [Deltaproteobacteria bacterium 
MRSLKNQSGQVVIFFVLLVPIFVLALVLFTKFSRDVFTKMKLQGALDRGVYAAASYQTEVLNQTALLNRKAHDLFLQLEKEFKGISQPNDEKARERIKNLWINQNNLYDEMDSLAKVVYERAFEIFQNEVKKDFPDVKLSSLYRVSPVLWDGPKIDFSFDKVKGTVIFDPTGHQKVPKTDFEARMAFVKDPSQTIAFVGAVETKNGLQAVAAAQPFGGSVWNFALSSDKDETLLYQTSMVPVDTLPLEDFNPDEIHH